MLDHGEKIAEGPSGRGDANERVREAYLGTRSRRMSAGRAGPPATSLLALDGVHAYYGAIHAQGRVARGRR